MKKKNVFLVLMLILGAAGMGYGASKLLPIEPPSSENPSSETSEDDSGEVINLNVINRHVLRAVNQTVTLTVTVLPANATDKTVVWSSSDPTTMSITGTTANTASVKCLQEFPYRSVTVTARATNGTPEETDDFTASCEFTYNIEIETVDIQLVTPATTSYTVGAKFNVKVLFTPSNATEQHTITVNTNYLKVNSSPYTEPGEVWHEIEVIAVTPASTTTPITVTTNDTAKTDSVSVYGGYHLGQGRYLDAGLNIAVTQPGKSTVNYDSSQLEAYASYGGTFAINTVIVITIPIYDFVSPATTITYSPTYFSVQSMTGSGLTNTGSGTLAYTGLGGAVLTLKVIAAGANSNVVFTTTAYPTNNAYRTLELPFGLKQPISGITIDIPEFDF